MAIIGTIRKHFSILAVVLIGLAITAFILSDLLTGPKGSRSNRAPVIGEVAGTDIKVTEYNQRVEENLEVQKINQGVDALTAQEAFNVRVSTWNQFLNEIIMGKEYERLDLTVTTEELFDLVQGPRPHRLITQYFVDPQTNAYNPQLVINFLQNLDRMQPEVRKQWKNLERFIKEDRLTQKYNTLVAKGYYIPTAFAKEEFEYRRKSAETRYVGVRYSTINDSEVTITDADYEKYYEENKHLYTQEESRDLDYVVFTVEPSADDRQKAREDFLRLYSEFLQTPDVASFVNSTSDNRYDSTWKKRSDLSATVDSILFNSPVGTIIPPYEENNGWHMAKLMNVEMRPDSVKAEHILVAYAGALRAAQSIKRTKISAETKADSLLRLIREDNTLMQYLAVQHSDDGSAKDNKGDLGWFADGMMVHSFNEAVVNGKVGDVVKVESPFGYHIIHITGKQEPVMKVRVAMVDRSIEPSSKTFQDIYTFASSFAGENNTREKFDRAVEEQGLDKRSATYLKDIGNTIAGLENPREIIRWAYAESVNLGEVSPVFDVGGMYVVAVLTAIREKGTIPLDQIKENLKNFVLNDKKAEYIINKIGGQNDIYQIARDFNTKVDTNLSISFFSRNIPGYGSEFQVIGRMFTLEEGQVSEPIKGNGGVFVVALDKYYTPPESTEYMSLQQQLMMAFRSRVSGGTTVYSALEKNAKITDNRRLYL